MNFKIINLIRILLVFVVLISNCKNAAEKKENALAYSDKKYSKVKANGGVHLRDEPNKESKSLRLIPNNSIVLIVKYSGVTDTIGSNSGHWLQVHYEGNRGYIFSPYLTELDAENLKLYGISIKKLETFAENTKDKKLASRYFKIAHIRYLNEGGSPYCSPESDLMNCQKACNKSLELDYCHNFKSKGANLDLKKFQEKIIDSIKNKNRQALLNLSLDCIAVNQICVNCDGGGTIPMEFKYNFILNNLDNIDFQNIKYEKEDIEFYPNANYKDDSQSEAKTDLPFLKIQIIKKDNLYYIENIQGKIIFGHSECMSGI